MTLLSSTHAQCRWIGEGEKCHHTAILDKAYCDEHYKRMYIVLLPEMADYILNKDLNYGTTI